jgi:hypothetical protein
MSENPKKKRRGFGWSLLRIGGILFMFYLAVLTFNWVTMGGLPVSAKNTPYFPKEFVFIIT